MDQNFKKAALYSVLAYFVMAIGIVAWKSVVASYSSAQILAIEAFVTLPLYLALAKITGGLNLLKTAYPSLQVLRGILQTLAAFIGLYGLLHLPISTYTMLAYVTPFIITLAAWLVLKEKCPPAGWLSILVGFIGTALIIQPEYSQNFTAVVACLLSCCFWAANVMLMKQMPKDHVLSFPFYTVLIVGAVSGIIVAFNGVTPMSLSDFSIVAVAGIFFFFGGQLLFMTYRLSPICFLSPFQYTEIVWVVILGYLLWAEVPSVIQVIGLLIIIAAATYSSFLQKNKAVSA